MRVDEQLKESAVWLRSVGVSVEVRRQRGVISVQVPAPPSRAELLWQRVKPMLPMLPLLIVLAFFTVDVVLKCSYQGYVPPQENALEDAFIAYNNAIVGRCHSSVRGVYGYAQVNSLTRSYEAVERTLYDIAAGKFSDDYQSGQWLPSGGRLYQVFATIEPSYCCPGSYEKIREYVLARSEFFGGSAESNRRWMDGLKRERQELLNRIRDYENWRHGWLIGPQALAGWGFPKNLAAGGRHWSRGEEALEFMKRLAAAESPTEMVELLELKR